MKTTPHTTPTHTVHVGELYAKTESPSANKSVYHVIDVQKNSITLQNVDNPLSQFETTAEKLINAGYARLSQTPYINLNATKNSKTAKTKLKRCPYTLDIFEARADSERPALATS